MDPAFSAITGLQTNISSDLNAELDPGVYSDEKPPFVVELDGSLPFYMLDAYEEFSGSNASNIYLFGKVKERSTYHSCCVVVKNMQRCMYAIPNGPVFEDSVIMKLFTPSFIGIMHLKDPIERKENYVLKISYPFKDPPLPSDLKGETFRALLGTHNWKYHQGDMTGSLLSKETGDFCLEQILSELDRSCEEVVEVIHNKLRKVQEDMRKGEIGLEKYIITKMSTRPPEAYPDAKSQPHVEILLAYYLPTWRANVIEVDIEINPSRVVGILFSVNDEGGVRGGQTGPGTYKCIQELPFEVHIGVTICISVFSIIIELLSPSLTFLFYYNNRVVFSLEKDYGMKYCPYEAGVDVFLSGYVFHLKILHERGLDNIRKSESYQVKRVSSKVARKELRMLKLAARYVGALREAKHKLEK
ncbi:unnamed protein product [Lactuca virosa]|uniref:DNA-directed DNA polymerase n=1 Tax=Lactuca virosa TaxID=75947 RepID=A0AAU9MHQ5_9ASTR|nr:unnamed protein product [Lactuca virosa]